MQVYDTIGANEWVELIHGTQFLTHHVLAFLPRSRCKGSSNFLVLVSGTRFIEDGDRSYISRLDPLGDGLHFGSW